MQCACAILSSVAFPVLLHFSTLSHKHHDLEKKLNIICVLIFSTLLPEIFLILRRTEQDTVTNRQRSAFKVPVILVMF